MSATVYVPLPAAMAILDELFDEMPAAQRLAVRQAQLRMVARADISAMSFESHNRIVDGVMRAAFNVKS